MNGLICNWSQPGTPTINQAKILLKGDIMKVTRKKNKKRDIDGILINPNKIKRLCKGFCNHGMLGRR